MIVLTNQLKLKQQVPCSAALASCFLQEVAPQTYNELIWTPRTEDKQRKHIWSDTVTRYEPLRHSLPMSPFLYSLLFPVYQFL